MPGTASRACAPRVSKSDHQPIRLISGDRHRLPEPQPICDQLRALLIVLFVKGSHVPWLGATVNTGRPRVQFRLRVSTGREVPSGAISGLQSNSSRPVQLLHRVTPPPRNSRNCCCCATYHHRRQRCPARRLATQRSATPRRLVRSTRHALEL